jgi:hypothetical protein
MLMLTARKREQSGTSPAKENPRAFLPDSVKSGG